MARSAPPVIAVEVSNLDFRGPLALLLELIERRSLPITEVSLAEVAGQYVERMESLVGLDRELLADFIVIASKLMVIKSRALLPSRPAAPEEVDVAAELEMRLLEYRLFKEAAERLRELEERGRRSYSPQAGDAVDRHRDAPLEPIAPEDLRAAMARMLKALKREPERLALAPRVSVEQRIGDLLDILSSRGSASFAEVAGATVGEIVATFLALLELIRRGTVEVEQERAFTEMRLSYAPPGIPDPSA